MNVLFVCTANQCRSPLAEALFRARVPDDIGIEVRSRGLLPGGVPCPPELLDVAGRVGLDLTDHLSETIGEDDLSWATLILTMAREHVREIVLQSPATWSRCFTLLEWMRRTGELQPGATSVGELVAAAGEGREMQSLLGYSDEDDVPDPMGLSRRAYEKLLTLLTPLVESLATQLMSLEGTPL